MEEKLVNLIIPDTNVLVNDPYCLDKFINGGNKIVIPLTVLTELNKLKNDPRVSYDAREVIRQIEKYGFGKNELFEVEKGLNFEGLDLDRKQGDYQIMATLNYVINSGKYMGFNLYKLVSSDVNMRSIAYSLFKDNPKVSIEVYKEEQVEQINSLEKIPRVTISDFPLDMAVLYNKNLYGALNQNAGVVIDYQDKKKRKKSSLFIRKGNYLQLIKDDYQMMGLKALSENDEPNYGQLLAFHNLLSPDVSCVFLQGNAGTGKTLIALAGGMSQRSRYEEFIVANPMIPLSNKDKMGFLPGDVFDKTAPWMVPFEQNLRFLEKNSADQMYKLVAVSGNKGANGKASFTQTDVNLRTKYGLIPQPLEYIRGQTISGAFIIVEEAQNLSQHEIKTIITRLGKDSKIIFCGDLSQIDIPYLTQYSSGLTYAIEKLVGIGNKNKEIASVMLDVTVRSTLAAFASSVL